MADSAHTWAAHTDRNQFGNLGKLRTIRGTITFGADYAAAVLPRITNAEVGLSEIVNVHPEGNASGTAAGAGVVVAVTTGGTDFTLKLYNGTTAIGTVDESATTISVLIIGH